MLQVAASDLDRHQRDCEYNELF